MSAFWETEAVREEGGQRQRQRLDWQLPRGVVLWRCWETRTSRDVGKLQQSASLALTCVICVWVTWVAWVESKKWVQISCGRSWCKELLSEQKKLQISHMSRHLALAATLKLLPFLRTQVGSITRHINIIKIIQLLRSKKDALNQFWGSWNLTTSINFLSAP